FRREGTTLRVVLRFAASLAPTVGGVLTAGLGLGLFGAGLRLTLALLTTLRLAAGVAGLGCPLGLRRPIALRGPLVARAAVLLPRPLRGRLTLAVVGAGAVVLLLRRALISLSFTL